MAAYISVTSGYSELVKIEILSKESYNYKWSTKNLGGQVQSALFPKEIIKTNKLGHLGGPVG